MTTSKYIFSILTLIATLCVTYFLLFTQQSDPSNLIKIKELENPFDTLPISGSIRSKTQNFGEDTFTQNQWLPTSLITVLKKSSNYSSFIRNALREPDKGGFFYAQTLMTKCSQIQFALETNSSNDNDTSKTAALKKFNLRCDLTPQQYQILLAENSAAEKRDPLIKIARDLASSDAEIKKSALTLALKSRDPLLIFETSALSFFRTEPSAMGNVGENIKTYFNGQWLDESEAIPLRYAQKLVACDFALPCDQNDTWLSDLCVTKGECANSRQEYMEQYVYPNQPDWENKVQRYRESIKMAVRNQYVEIFVP